ncbi:coiled-coil domain-containing protein 25 isoform X1 [Folsomia candida]|uniref:coiled-coil domain-containing protein 25 isoform X1 n=1 Tax=Folsomia candida TaxID=158441 RepID=UPI000B8FB63D|nr:coiled-coil domain-containing protein 25 isoform X1 [Folsomia candida]
MVYYITSNIVDPPVTLFMGEDKHENEELIRWGWPEDVWFHVDKLSSAHVYLRLRPGETLDSVPSVIIDEACQLVKDNSIQGRKMASVDVVYTLWSNLKKTPGMEVGQVGFHVDKDVKLVKNVPKRTEICKRLEKTKSENMKLDFRTLREERDAKERAQLREKERKAREHEKVLEKKRAEEAELKNYTSLMKTENMKTNQDNSGSDSDDFM